MNFEEVTLLLICTCRAVVGVVVLSLCVITGMSQLHIIITVNGLCRFPPCAGFLLVLCTEIKFRIVVIYVSCFSVIVRR